jgi:hypothetical protein
MSLSLEGERNTRGGWEFELCESFSTISFSKCLIQIWTKSDVADTDSESECSENTEHTYKR